MKKKRKNYGTLFLSLFIALIMITSILGYIFADNTSQSFKYNGYKFTATDKGWMTTIQGNPHYFAYSPRDLENLNYSINIDPSLKEIDITYFVNSSFRETFAASIFSLATAVDQTIFIRPGFTTQTPYDEPVIDCNDATPTVPVIKLVRANETTVIDQDNCIMISSQDQNFFKAYSDRIAYDLLGIMD